MKLTVLIPSEEYRNNAGARIRYGRIAPELERHGVRLTFEDISKFDARTVNCDLLLVSKCYDARSLVAAEILSRRGLRVGVDLFDDYFSQIGDSRMVRFRGWLRQMLARSDFALCSTLAMQKVIERYAPSVAVHVLNDPAPPIDEARLAAILREKRDEARASGRLKLAWFGVGDNPHFSVGLSDLSAFSGAPRLAWITALPVTHISVEEWTEAAEAELLSKAFATFLPVNAQGFSSAKSLNRAVTALAAGCQVLSAGYPLYEALNPLIYQAADEFIHDMREQRMRLAPETIELLLRKVDQIASAQREAESLIDFFEKLKSDAAPAERSPQIFLVNGVATNGTAHKMVQAVGGLSVATPFSTAPLNYDIVFHNRPGHGLAMLVSDKALSRLRPEMQRRAAPFGPLSGRNFWEVAGSQPIAEVDPRPKDVSLSLRLALYPQMMQSILAALEDGFGAGATIVSETSPLPFMNA